MPTHGSRAGSRTGARRVKPPLRKRKDGTAVMKVTSRTVDAINDPDSIHDWDDDELEKGYRKASNGKFVGRPPRVVPTECHRELARRLISKATMIMTTDLPLAFECLHKVMASESAEDKDKIAAARLIIERCMGKVPDRVAVQMDTPKWTKALEAGIVSVMMDDKDDEVIDAEVVEEFMEEAS